MISKNKLAYFAGIVDGEGTIQIIRQSNKGRKPYHTTGFYISNTNLSLLKWIKNNFGGNITNGRKYKGIKFAGGDWYDSSNWKKCYRLQFYGEVAEKLVELIYPYLIVKKKQAKLYLSFRKRLKIYKHPLLDKEYNIRERMYKSSRKLNARGIKKVQNVRR